MANSASWSNVYKRINEKRKAAGLTWNQVAAKAGIKKGTWMTGVLITHPTEEEVRKIAAVPEMNTTYAYLRYGITDLSELE